MKCTISQQSETQTLKLYDTTTLRLFETMRLRQDETTTLLHCDTNILRWHYAAKLLTQNIVT